MVKPGYKQTELGIIPEDWILMPSGEFIEVLTDFTANGSFASLAENVTYLDYPDYARLVRLTDIRTNFKNQGIYVSKASYEFLAKSSLFGGELLLANVGAYAGYSFLFQKNFQEYATLGPNMFLIKANKNILREEYVPLVFGYGSVFKQLLDAAASSAQPKINKDNVRKSVAIIPPLDEQKRIAEALSDVDSMISSLEKLIAKKKAVKQGTMQELLTGKKRLPGFDGDIKYKSLASLCTVFADGDWIESKDQSNDGIRLIQTGNIGVGKYLDKTDKQRFISTDTFDRLKCLEIFENDVIVSRLPEPAGRACILPYSNKRRITAVDCTIIRFADYNPILFVAYSQTKQYQDKVDMAMAGSTRQRISRKELGEIPIPVFPTIEEQNALASIFSDMDSEIEALEQKLEKTRQIKQGMMQQLLTGKIRLV